MVSYAILRCALGAVVSVFYNLWMPTDMFHLKLKELWVSCWIFNPATEAEKFLECHHICYHL